MNRCTHIADELKLRSVYERLLSRPASKRNSRSLGAFLPSRASLQPRREKHQKGLAGSDDCFVSATPRLSVDGRRALTTYFSSSS